jgi:hypothetical protein
VAARSLTVSALPVRALAVGWGRQGVSRLLHLCAARGGHFQPQPPRLHVESGDASPGRAIDCGSAHRGQVPGAALPCKPRAAPAGAGCWLAPGPPCDRAGHQPHESRTPTPTRSHPAHVVPQASRCPAMPPASSTSGGAHGVLSHAMSPVCETTFDLCASTLQSVLTFSLRHAAVTACLQSSAKMSSTVRGLA